MLFLLLHWGSWQKLIQLVGLILKGRVPTYLPHRAVQNLSLVLVTKNALSEEGEQGDKDDSILLLKQSNPSLSATWILTSRCFEGPNFEGEEFLEASSYMRGEHKKSDIAGRGEEAVNKRKKRIV